METVIVPVDGQCPEKLRVLRGETPDAFIETHASGTLRKNRRLGMAWKAQYLEERIAWEFGWAFECQTRSRVTFGDAFTEADCKPITEAGWHIERYITRCPFPEDAFETKYIVVEYGDGRRKEGIGMVVRSTSASFIPCGHLVFAVVAEYDPIRKIWRDAVNPS